MITNLADTVKRLSHYLPSLPPDVSAVALASDFAGRMCAATPISVVDPPYAPRRLKASLMAAMERHGPAMEPTMRLHGDGPCIPSPSVIASASQLMAVLQKTGKKITRIELLYKGTVHGFKYTDMLHRVGDASPLLFLIRANGDIHGFSIDTSLQPPPERRLPPGSRAGHRTFNRYEAAALIFKAFGASPPTFQPHSLMPQCIYVSQADDRPRDSAGGLMVGQLGSFSSLSTHQWLELWTPPPFGSVQAAGRCCGRRPPFGIFPVMGYQMHMFVSDEVEVFTLLQ
ncbi:unnamed protein product [Vitrella brassicaformis CCMP3155]|uniref:TLDc domain-containing protein n=1 Tax=Vitrella brassicaformis (strain CCMP3155) TaxID=1169540 RepID=A0A0G4EXM0_VITBC|nr:unnamed protein product [Vitrella brassicaformis CCMP3155]|eukprot:CEM03466.1 unnamed protein product [Vitrella brassicaformis CCMP3155]